MKDVTFGQFYPANSFIHKMSAPVKIILSIAYIVGVFLVKQYYFLGFALSLLFVLCATFLAKVPLIKVIKSIKGILFFIILTAILQLLLNKDGEIIFEWSFIHITNVGIYSALYIIIRITLVVLGASLLTLTTTPTDLADGIEVLLYPLKFIKFPVHEFALIMSIALRFIPTLLGETERIIKAQKSRGADFETGNLFKKIKALVPVLIPLLISSFRRADELADAMDSRCYSGSEKRTKYKKISFTKNDLFGIIFMGLFIFGVITLNGVLGVNL